MNGNKHSSAQPFTCTVICLFASSSSSSNKKGSTRPRKQSNKAMNMLAEAKQKLLIWLWLLALVSDCFLLLASTRCPAGHILAHSRFDRDPRFSTSFTYLSCLAFACLSSLSLLIYSIRLQLIDQCMHARRCPRCAASGCTSWWRRS